MSNTEPVELICAKFAESLARGTFARLALSSPVEVVDAPEKVLGRFVMLKGVPHLSLTLRYPTRDVTKNLPKSDAVSWLRAQLGTHFRSALVCTTQRDWQFISNEAGVARLIDHQPSAKKTPSPEHDRKRAGLLDDSARDWLQGLDVLDREGKLRVSMADKHRQINHYLEIFSHLAKECGWMEKNIQHPTSNIQRPMVTPTPERGAMEVGCSMLEVGCSQTNAPNRSSALQLVDMGCGKGYLTFGLWHLFSRVWKQPVRVIGVETRADLVSTTNKLARQIKADGLEFVRGEIQSVKLPPVDALIALHACNTATDDAIRRGIELGAKLIVVAPCCHKELRPQLGKPEPLAAVLRHGLMEERMAEWATDGLRALFLEWAGYRTKILEFVASEHTPKNLMIAAIREGEPFVDDAARKKIEELKNFFSVQHQVLDPLLGKNQTAS
ncbi:MAG: SAM-dependent methyltransferase [Pedosphaera sp.]|nr:SAM-dependent methyltransferase [Pedosphaera sp.]